jgi:hypothetical protein
MEEKDLTLQNAEMQPYLLNENIILTSLGTSEYGGFQT